MTLIPKDKLGGHPPSTDKGKKGKKDGTKGAARDEIEEDNEQPELPIVKDHATRGVLSCSNVCCRVISPVYIHRKHIIL